ncbi:MAG: twin-arginine translocase subunit TatC [Tannerellaceae bacterium]|jgi:sec-independent protein translocase protein TatC|nr:twin-arginine translocase subunit TatC [Tannerellaceae bacterium]
MEDQAEMSFWDHLEELRWTLFRSLVALAVFAGGIFGCMRGEGGLFDRVVLAPTRGDFFTYRVFCKVGNYFGVSSDFCDGSFRVDIFNIRMASQFFTHMTTSLWMALLLTFPYLMYEMWRFIRPALYRHEERNIRLVFLLGTLMFFAGCAVGYFTVFPLTLRFLASYRISPTIVEQVSLESYMDNFLLLIFIMGLIFEMPLLSWLLSRLGLLHRDFFHRYRRHAVVALLIAAALITPSGDPFTLTLVFIPLYLLYEISAFFTLPQKTP